MSLDPADRDLLQRHLDGEASPEEVTALHGRLSREPDLREHHELLLDVRRQLDGVGLVDPPPGLWQDILQAVRRSPGPGERAGWTSWLAPFVARRPAFALASTLAAGVVAGILLTSALAHRPLPAIDESSVSGTVLPGSHLGDLPVVDRVRLEGAGMRAEAVARKGSGLVVADLVIHSDRAAAVFVETGGSGLALRGFAAPDGLPAGGAVLEAGGIYVAEAPPGRYRLVLSPVRSGSGDLRIRIQSPEGAVEDRLRPGPVPAPNPETQTEK